MTITILAAELGGFVVETVLIGAYYAVFLLGLHAVFAERYRRSSVGSMLRSPINLSYFLIFACVTANWTIDLVKLFNAFLYHDDTEPLAMYAASSNLNGNWTSQTVLYLVEVLCADAILIFRLHVIYKRSFAITVLPILTCALATVSVIISVKGFISSDGSDATGWPPLSGYGKWLVIAFSSTLVTNFYCTSLIAWRVWKSYAATKEIKAVRQSSTTRIVQVIVESAAVYSACTLTVLVAYCVHSNFYLIAYDATYPLAGLVFSSIIVRIRLFGEANIYPTSQATSQNFGSASHQLQPIAVQIRRDEITTDRDSEHQIAVSLSKVNTANV